MPQRPPAHADPPRPGFIKRIDQHGDLRIVRLQGTIDQHTVEAGYEYIKRLRRGEAINNHLLLDCANVTRVDLSAVALLVVRMQDYLAAGRTVSIMHVDGRMKTYLELAQMAHRVRIFDSEADAVGAILGSTDRP